MYQLGSRLASPIRFEELAGPFQPRDVVLTNRWAFWLRTPRRGDVVAFQPRWGATTASDYAGLAATLHMRLRVEENLLVDRLVGLPGDHVVWENHSLTVNGEPARPPLVPGRLPPKLEITVPSGRYLVLPSTSRVPDVDWTIGMVEIDHIEAGVFLRISPLSRFWIIR